MREWAGKRYWLVGASDGLGAALAHRMSRAGVQLVLSARSEGKLTALANALPGPAEVRPVDVTTPMAAPEGIDGMVYLAGAYWPMAATEWDSDRAATMVDVNLTGAIRTIGACLPAMVDQGAGHIVLTGSLSAYRGLPGAVGYGASKAGLFSLAETIDLDLCGTGVEVQVIHPGFIRSNLTDKNTFNMPQIMEPDTAALEMFEQMTAGGFKSAFPAPFSFFMRSTQLWPNWLYRWMFGRQ